MNRIITFVGIMFLFISCTTIKIYPVKRYNMNKFGKCPTYDMNKFYIRQGTKRKMRIKPLR